MSEALEEVRDSYGQSVGDADAFHKLLLSFEFFCISSNLSACFAYTRTITLALQGSNCGLLKAHRMAQHLVKVLEDERTGDKKA